MASNLIYFNHSTNLYILYSNTILNWFFKYVTKFSPFPWLKWNKLICYECNNVLYAKHHLHSSPNEIMNWFIHIHYLQISHQVLTMISLLNISGHHSHLSKPLNTSLVQCTIISSWILVQVPLKWSLHK